MLRPPDAKSRLLGKDPDAGTDWGQEEKGTTENERVGWHHRLNGHGLGWTLGVGEDREAWRVSLHGVAKSQTRLSNRTMKITSTNLREKSLVPISGRVLALLWALKEESRNWRCIAHDGRITENWRPVDPGVLRGPARRQNSGHRSHHLVFWESTMRTRVHKVWWHREWCVMDGHGRGSGVNSSSIHDGKWFSLGNCPPEILHQSQHHPVNAASPWQITPALTLTCSRAANGNSTWKRLMDSLGRSFCLGAAECVSNLCTERSHPKNARPGPKWEEMLKMREPMKVTHTVQGDESLLRKLWISGSCACVFVQSVSRSWLFETPWTVARQAPLSMGFSRQEYWSGLPRPPPGGLPNSGIEPTHSAVQADSLSVSCCGQFNPVHQNNKKVRTYILWPFQHSFAVSPTKEHGLFIYFSCIQTVTKSLKCCYLEMYLKYLSCFAKDVTMIFFLIWEWE